MASKASTTSYHPVNQYWDALLRCPSLVWKNPTGAGLVSLKVRGHGIQSTMTPIPLNKTTAAGHLHPQLTPGTIDVTAGWAASPVDTRQLGPQV